MNNLLHVRGFIPLVAVVYLNAFIDLGHKIIIQNTVFKIYDGSQQIILTAIVNALILIPFVIFFYTAGKTSDRYAKTRILRSASIAALLITCAISFCYWQGFFWSAFALTFFLGVQSAYYGPAKYGLLKELVSNQQLATANGIAQALATIGILSGILIFSILFEHRFSDVTSQDTDTIIKTMTPLSLLLIIISGFECCIAWTIPIIAPVEKTTSENITREIKTMIQSPILFPAIIGLSVFWSVGQMLLAAYPAFAKSEIGITNTVVIQGLLATIGIGVMAGSVLAGRLSRTHIEISLIPIAGLGIIAIAFLLPVVTEVIPAVLMFLSIGIVGGLLIVPLNAIVQYCTPQEKLGITIGNSNLMQNIAMLTCLIVTVTAALFQLSAKSLLFFIAIVACIGISFVILKLPQTLIKITHKPCKKLVVEGFNNLPGSGPLLLLINTDIEDYKTIVQMAYPRKISFVSPANWNKDSVCCLLSQDLPETELTEEIAVIDTSLLDEKDYLRLVFTHRKQQKTSL